MRIPVRTTEAVKEPRLRNRVGYLLMDHEYTNMATSFIIELPDEEQLLQCGSWEFEALDRDDPDYPKMTWRDVAIAHPEFVQWVVAKHGPLPEGEVDEGQYNLLAAAYTETSE